MPYLINSYEGWQFAAVVVDCVRHTLVEAIDVIWVDRSLYFVLLVVAIVATATGVALVRVSVEDGEFIADGKSPTGQEVKQALDFDHFRWSDYAFLRAYGIEFTVSLFIYYPVIETILFSGLLGCWSGKVPILGGRPGQIERERTAAAAAASWRGGDGGEVQGTSGGVLAPQVTMTSTRPRSLSAATWSINDDIYNNTSNNQSRCNGW